MNAGAGDAASLTYFRSLLLMDQESNVWWICYIFRQIYVGQGSHSILKMKFCDFGGKKCNNNNTTAENFSKILSDLYCLVLVRWVPFTALILLLVHREGFDLYSVIFFICHCT